MSQSRPGKRRLAVLPSSSDEEDAAPPPPPPRSKKPKPNDVVSEDEDDNKTKSRSKKPKPNDAVSEDEDDNKSKSRSKKRKPNDVVSEDEDENKTKSKKSNEEEKPKEKENESSSGDEDEDEEDDGVSDAKPIGEVVRVSGKGRNRRNHYSSFEYDSIAYELEDPVLLVPEEQNQKPYVAIIKDITETKEGNVMVSGQWFYRPEEAEKKSGGNWKSSDTRELFYSFHRDEVPAESVMHKCVVHFIPKNKQIPNRKEHPGFIVQKVYDTDLKRLFKLTDKDYEDNKQHEIDILVQKTLSRLGDLPDIESEDGAGDEDKSKRFLRRKNVPPPIDVSRDEETATRFGQPSRAETPASCPSNASEYYQILAKFNALTGEVPRDRHLEKMLEAVRPICQPEATQKDNKVNDEADGVKPTSPKSANGESQKSLSSFVWPDAAVPAIAALEKASHESLSTDFGKYNQKMRSLSFNLKCNAALARRLLMGELEPSKILNMSPNELKEGLTAEEIASKQPEEERHIQMTDTRCKRCSEKKVGIVDIIQAGHGDRYQLECTACGNTWFSSRDEASILTIDGPSSAKSVGAAPLATSKIKDIEKKMLSPREPGAANEALKKATEPFGPALETQKSFNKAKPDDKSKGE